jgi:hypothetical protein
VPQILTPPLARRPSILPTRKKGSDMKRLFSSSATRAPLLFGAVLLALLAAGCRRSDVRTLTLSLPRLSETDKPLIEQALAKYNGVEKDSYLWDFQKKTLTLRYDSMQIARTNIRMAIADKGVSVVFPTNTTGRAGY